jgi:hypothetical protein
MQTHAKPSIHDNVSRYQHCSGCTPTNAGSDQLSTNADSDQLSTNADSDQLSTNADSDQLSTRDTGKLVLAHAELLILPKLALAYDSLLVRLSNSQIQGVQLQIQANTCSHCHGHG